MTADDIEAAFTEACNSTLGTVAASRFDRRTFIRKMTRKLIAHFDTNGWPESKDEVMVYVREALDRYC